MLRFAAIFARLRWRLTVNAVRKSRRRDSLERVSRFAEIVLPFLFVLAVLASSVAIAAIAGYCGWKLGEDARSLVRVLVAARLSLLVMLAVIVLFALGGATQSAVARSSRILLMPIPRRALHRVEVLANLADPWVVCTAPALVAFAAGFLLAGRIEVALVALAAAVALTCVLITLGALLSFAVGWLMRGRRRGELFALVLVLLLSVAGLVPMLLARGDPDAAGNPSAREVTIDLSGTTAIERFDAKLPAWTRALPSELYARCVRSALAEDARATSIALAALALEALLLFALSALAHKKLLDAGESGGSSRRRRVSVEAGRRLPGSTRAVSAVALAQARTALRSVRGRLAVLLSAPLILFFGFVSLPKAPELEAARSFGSNGPLLFGAGLVFSLYTYLALTMNQFASDRAGLTLQFLTPLSDRELVRGKAIGHALVLCASGSLCLAASLAVAPSGSPLTWISVALGCTASYLLIAPFAVALSALFPVAADLGKTGKGGNPHNVAMLLGSLLVALSALPPAAIVLWSERAADRAAIGLAWMAGWAAISAAISIPLLGASARIVTRRRENLGLVAQGR